MKVHSPGQSSGQSSAGGVGEAFCEDLVLVGDDVAEALIVAAARNEEDSLGEDARRWDGDFAKRLLHIVKGSCR